MLSSVNKVELEGKHADAAVCGQPRHSGAQEGKTTHCFHLHAPMCPLVNSDATDTKNTNNMLSRRRTLLSCLCLPLCWQHWVPRACYTHAL